MGSFPCCKNTIEINDKSKDINVFNIDDSKLSLNLIREENREETITT